MSRLLLAILPAVLYAMPLNAADPPSAEISNGQIRAHIYLPDARNGFYRGTRFDWSGVINSLQYKKHEFYGPWFNSVDQTVHDFVYRGDSIVAGPCSGTVGPVDSFEPLGWENAAPGATFVKIGVGVLRKPADDTKKQYDQFHLYEIADGGKWSVHRSKDAIEFTQVVNDASSGFGYEYRKTVRLVAGKPEMVLEHSLRNTGKQEIRSNVFNHNFTSLDRLQPGPGLSIELPFTVQGKSSPLAEIKGKQIDYIKDLKEKDTFASVLTGYGKDDSDNGFRVSDTRAKAGMSVRGDRPLSRLNYWSIRSVISMEPFILVDVQPGKEFRWSSTYLFSAE